MLNRMFFLACIMMLAIFLNCAGQEKLSVQQMHNDIDFYFDTLQLCNPALYQRYPTGFYDSIRINLKGKITKPLSGKEFGNLFAKTNKYMNIHTGIAVDYWEPQLKDSLGFPGIKVNNGKIFLDKHQIISINKIPVAEIEDFLNGTTSWEYNQSGKDIRMARSFPLILQNDYNIYPPYKCQLYNTENNKKIDSIVQAVHLDKINEVMRPSYTEYHKLALDSAFFEKDKIAVLYYNACDTYTDSMKAIFDNLTTSFFKKTKELDIKYLFIDVSQNGGGTFSHNYILRFLDKKPIVAEMKMYFTEQGLQDVYDQNLKSLSERMGLKTKEEIEKLEKEAPMFSHIREQMRSKEFCLIQPYYAPLSSNPNLFNGTVFLVTGETYSSASDFSEIFKRAQIGKIVGNEVGQRIPYGGTAKSAYLPNSNIRFQFSTSYTEIEPIITNSEGFLQPDIPYPLDSPLKVEDYKEIIRLSKGP